MKELLKNLVGTVAPTIGTALGGPMGGMAANMIADVLGCDNDPKSIQKPMDSATPEQMLELKKAEAEFLGQTYDTPEGFEKNSKFNKWAFSTMFAAPEVILDRATTA